MKLFCAFIILYVLIGCSQKSFIIRLKDYIPTSEYRDGLELSPYKLSSEDSTFVTKQGIDSFQAFKRGFADYQFLYNSWKKNEIDSIGYKFRLLKYRYEDSLNKQEYSNQEYRNTAITSDTSINADVKILFGIKIKENKLIIIVDENNNNTFSDDKIIILNRENYRNVFDTLKINVSGLKYISKNTNIVSTSLPIHINSIGDNNKNEGFPKKFTPWISASYYYTGEKTIKQIKKYFYFNVFYYNLGYPSYKIIIGENKININHLSKNDTTFNGSFFRSQALNFQIDSISTKNKKAYITRHKH